MFWRQVRHGAEYLAFRLVVCVIQALSPRLCARLSRGMAAALCRWLPHRLTRHDVARANLHAAFPGRFTERQIDRLIYRMWVHLFRMVAEIIQLPRRLRLGRFLLRLGRSRRLRRRSGRSRCRRRRYRYRGRLRRCRG